MALTDTFIRQVKHSGNSAGDKHTDGQGMFLLVNKAGKYWRLSYRFAGEQKTLALGAYPDVPLAQACSSITSNYTHALRYRFHFRLRVSPAVQNVDSEPATGAPEWSPVDDSAIAATVAAIFAPIMASLDRIEKYVDTLPDKPTGAA